MRATKEQVEQKIRQRNIRILPIDNLFEILVADILQIVNEGKKDPPRGNTLELRFPEDRSTFIAWHDFNVDAYSD
jgi:hypothetical protein